MPITVGGGGETDAHSEASGSASTRSAGSRRKYRVVSRGSSVDESLFGTTKSNNRRSKKGDGRRVLRSEVRDVASAYGCERTVSLFY